MKVTKTFCDICGAESRDTMSTRVCVDTSIDNWFRPEAEHRIGDVCPPCRGNLKHVVKKAIQDLKESAKP